MVSEGRDHQLARAALCVQVVGYECPDRQAHARWVAVAFVMSLASATSTPLPNNDPGHEDEVCGQFPASNLEDRVLSTSHNRNV